MVNQPNVWNPNKIVRISAFYWFEQKLLPNQSYLSEIRTRSDFGIPLYLNESKKGILMFSWGIMILLDMKPQLW